MDSKMNSVDKSNMKDLLDYLELRISNEFEEVKDYCNDHEINEWKDDVVSMISEELLNHEEFVLEAIKISSWMYDYASEELKTNIPFLLQVLASDFSLFGKMKSLKIDWFEIPEFMDILKNAIISSSGWFMRYANDEMKKDKTLILESLKNAGEYSLKYADDVVFDDYEFLLEAASINGMILHWIIDFYRNTPFWHDRKLTMTAVANTGIALKYAAPEFQNDREIVMTAVSNCGNAIRYASEVMGSDVKVLAAACANGWIIPGN